jgi:hypothetical protein
LGIFDWFHGADTVLDDVQTLAQTENRLPLHPYDMVRRLFPLLAHNNTDGSTSAVTPLVGLVLVLAHRSYLCSLLALHLSGGLELAIPAGLLNTITFSPLAWMEVHKCDP